MIKNLLFLGLTAIALISCTPQGGGQKSASCGFGESYDKVSQKCVNVREAPATTLKTFELNEDSAPSYVTLTYDDANGDQASSCKVTENFSQIEAVAPIVYTDLALQMANIVAEADFVRGKVETLIAPGTGSVDVLYANVVSSYALAKESTSNSSLYAYIDSIRSLSTQIANVALSNTPTYSFGLAFQTSLTSFAKVVVNVGNRCECIGGVCKVAIWPRTEVSGSFGLTYTITDPIDGESNPTQMIIDVLPVNDAPVAKNGNVSSISESTNSAATTNTFVLTNVFSDVDSSIVSLDISSPSTGSFSNCMILAGAHLTCDYTSPNGSSNSVGAAATNSLGNVIFTAKAFGTSGNSIVINYVEHLYPDFDNDIKVKVSGNTININFWSSLATADEIVSKVNSTPEAAALVSAQAVGGAGAFLQTTGQTVTLSGGVAPLVTFSYRVLDSNGLYSNIATGTIDVTPHDDAPVIDLANITYSPSPVTLTSFVMTVPFSDEEGDAVNTTCSFPVNTSFFVESACACSNVTNTCTATLKPKGGVVGVTPITMQIAQNSVPANTDTQVISINVGQPSGEAPYPVNHAALGTEGATAQVAISEYVAISTDAFIDDVVNASYSFSVSDPANGTLTGCALITDGTTKRLDCTYVPDNGNVSGVSTQAVSNFQLGTGINCITLTANTGGVWANNISVTTASQLGMSAGDEFAVVSGFAITVYVEAGVSTCTQVAQAINNSTKASSFVTASPVAPAQTVGAAAAELMTANVTTAAVDGADFFTYTISDGTNTSHQAYVTINVTPTNDAPLFCQYSSFTDAPECNNLLGCIGSGTPSGSIKPNTIGIRYYDQDTATCYVSNGTSSNTNWVVATDDGLDTLTVTQREKVIIKRIRVDEGGGNIGGNENAETLVVKSLTSSNTNLVPADSFSVGVFKGNTRVKISGAYANDVVETTPANSSDDEDIRIEVIPVSSLVGESDIVLTFSDGTNDLDVSFKVVVNNISATHGNWENIKAIGATQNRIDEITGQDYACSYSKTSCNGSTCTGSFDPSAGATQVTPDALNALFYRTDTKECYKSTGTTAGDWEKIETHCQISPSAYATGCTGASCIGSGSPSGVVTPKAVDVLYLDEDTNTCYQSTGTTNTSWKTYTATASVFLDFGAFSVSGGSLVGYNVYRRPVFEEFDYEVPLNKTTIAASQTYYTDNLSNSTTAPTSGTLYFYEVRPVVQETGTSNKFNASTTEAFTTLRVVVPHENQTLVHRWIVNKTMCEKMQKSTDSSNNYRCLYEGLGGTANAPGSNYYDFGRDLLVDRFEAGCPYTKSPACIFTPDGTCLGISDPSNGVDSATSVGDIYYARSSGKCWHYDGAASWSIFDGTQTASDYNHAELPPLVNISQTGADSFCRAQTLSNIVGVCNYSTKSCVNPAEPTKRIDCRGAGAPTINPIAGSPFYYDETNKACYQYSGSWNIVAGNMIGQSASLLPSRKDQTAYSEWYINPISAESGTSEMTDAAVTNLETGLALNVQAKCNTTSANGLETDYTDSDSPNSNARYTLPAIASSSIRSVMTGATQTNSCISKYAVQDHVGNVSEWTSDRFVCPNGAFTCQAINDVDNDVLELNSTTDNFRYADGSDLFTVYNFDGNSGPCDDTGAGCGADLSSWLYKTKLFGASYFVTPMGVPLDVSYNTTFSGSPTTAYTSLIGPSTGITQTQLHEDLIDVNMGEISRVTNTSNCGGVVGGGSYTSGNGAGTYYFKLHPCEDDTVTSGISEEIGFRCVAPAGGYLE